VTASALPAALAPWSQALAALEPAVAIALGPLVQRLDELLTQAASLGGGSGPMDGYDGLSPRGIPERLLPSEWLLADELPLEFLRRAASHELLHLAPARPREGGRGRVAVVADTGPGQLGPARLVQLAALVVLHRRAAGRGADLALGILGESPGSWRTGTAAVLLDSWLRARRATDPTPEDLHGWAASVEVPDEAWLLTTPERAALVPGWRRCVATRVSAWGAAGATAVRVTIRGAGLELRLPPQAQAVRVLRGAGFAAAAPAQAVAGMRHPSFPSSRRRLLARGTGSTELLSVTVPSSPEAPAGRVRRHQFPGPVLAAGWVDRRRLVVLLALPGDRLGVRVIGRRSDWSVVLEGLSADLGDLGLDGRSAAAAADAGLAGLYPSPGRYGDGLLFSLGRDWWLLRPGQPPRTVPVAAAAASRHGTRVATRYSGRIDVVEPTPPNGPWSRVPEGAAVALDGEAGIAWSTDAVTWTVQAAGTELARIEVERGARVLGLAAAGGQPALVTVSPAGLIVRLCKPDGVRTLTTWSGGAGPPAVHPTLGLLAVQRQDGAIQVGEIGTGRVLLTLQAAP
jgi:hypothetical protein